MKHIEQLRNRLSLLGSQYTDTQALKQFREAFDPAREAFLMVLRARMDEIKNLIKIVTNDDGKDQLLRT